jgi:hypothetical protein
LSQALSLQYGGRISTNSVMEMIEGQGIAKNCVLFPEFFERRGELRADAQSYSSGCRAHSGAASLPKTELAMKLWDNPCRLLSTRPVYSQVSLPMIRRIALRAPLDFRKRPTAP